MKKLTAIALSVAITGIYAHSAAAQDSVNGYTRQDGTTVQPYERTAPDDTQTDNYSYQGNVNPYTGRVGTEGDSQSESSSYSGERSNSGF
jgi:hypothetical protein